MTPYSLHLSLSLSAPVFFVITYVLEKVPLTSRPRCCACLFYMQKHSNTKMKAKIKNVPTCSLVGVQTMTACKFNYNTIEPSRAVDKLKGSMRTATHAKRQTKSSPVPSELDNTLDAPRLQYPQQPSVHDRRTETAWATFCPHKTQSSHTKR